jgi:hypothetical protein
MAEDAAHNPSSVVVIDAWSSWRSPADRANAALPLQDLLYIFAAEAVTAAQVSPPAHCGIGFMPSCTSRVVGAFLAPWVRAKPP